MNHIEERIALLLALSDLARVGLPADLGVLAGRLAWGVGRVARVLGAIEAKGLVDRERCRLTLPGLAMATALGARREHAVRAA